MRKVDTAARYEEDLNNWVRQEEKLFVIGLTDFGQKFVGVISAVSDLPTIGQRVEKGRLYGVLEADKAASEIHLPVGGIVAAVNETLFTSPQLINEDCYNAGWLLKLKDVNVADWAALKSAEYYETSIRSFFNKE